MNEFEEESTEEKLEKIQKKCGEIFMNEYESFNFLCTFCTKILEDVETFKKHIKNDHKEQCKQKVFTTNRRKSSSSSKANQKTSTITHNIEPSIEFVSFEYIEAKEEPNSPPLTPAISDNKDNIELELSVLDYKVRDEEDEEKYSIKLSQKSDGTEEIPKSSNDLEFQKIELNVKEIDKCESLNSRIKPKKRDTSKKSKRKSKGNSFCEICNKKFYSIVSLRSHLKYDHETKNSLTHEFSAEDDQLEDPLKCRYCKRKFRSRKDRFEHEYSHTGQKPYECDVCGKRYYIRYAYKNHIAIHKNERPFKCEICPAGFNSSSTLNVHIRRHKNEKKYKCRYCDKTFVYSTPLKIHERVHTGEKPYQCTECGICLISSSALRKHNICYHIVDKPYKCQYCGRLFSANREKKEHERIHTGEKPFICEICSASFRTGKTYRNHKKNHSNEGNKISEVEQSNTTT